MDPYVHRKTTEPELAACVGSAFDRNGLRPGDLRRGPIGSFTSGAHPPRRRKTLALFSRITRVLSLAIVWIAMPGCQKDVEDWLQDVRSPDEYQRLLAVTAIGASDPAGHEAAIAAELLDVLEDPEPTVKEAALEALTGLAPLLLVPLVELAATADVVHYLGAPPPTFVRQSAAGMAEKAGDAAIPVLLSALHDPATLDRGLIARTLGRLGEGAIQPLIDVVNTAKDPFLRSLAAMGLRDALASAPEIARELLKGSSASDAHAVALEIVRQSVQNTMPKELTPEWVESRLLKLFGEDSAAALQSELELRIIGEDLVDHLITLLDTKGPTGRYAALLLIRLDHPSLARAFEKLDPDRGMHAQVLERLLVGTPEPQRALPLLVPLLTSGHTPLARRALLVLKGLGALSEPALPTIRYLANKGPEALRTPAMTAAKAIEGKIQ